MYQLSNIIKNYILGPKNCHTMKNIREENEDDTSEAVDFDFSIHNVAKEYHINNFGLEFVDHFLS